MKITKRQLKQIIKEELQRVLSEQKGPISSLYPRPLGTSPGDRDDFVDHQTHQKNMAAYQEETGRHPDEDPEAFVRWADGRRAGGPGLNYRDDMERTQRHAAAQADLPVAAAHGRSRRDAMRSRRREE